MARKNKKGLDYFPLDVDFFDDDKIELINAEFGIKGENIALRLLCLIYRNGYWYKLTEDECLLLAKRVGNGITGSLVSEVVKGLVKRSFFDEGVFNSFSILTSRGIQNRFFEAVERRKVVEIIPEIMLIDFNVYINKENVNINSINANKSTQSKVEESKVKERRADPPPEIIFPFDSENFKNQWKHWKEYKKKDHKFKFKSEESEQAALSQLSAISRGDEKTAIAIIHQSMGNGWKGFFELKTEKNGNNSGYNEKSGSTKQLIGQSGFGSL